MIIIKDSNIILIDSKRIRKWEVGILIYNLEYKILCNNYLF